MPMVSDTTGPIPELILARIHTFHASDMSQILRVTCGHPMRADQKSEKIPGAMLLGCFTATSWRARKETKLKANGNESISSQFVLRKRSKSESDINLYPDLILEFFEV